MKSKIESVPAYTLVDPKGRLSTAWVRRDKNDIRRNMTGGFRLSQGWKIVPVTISLRKDK